MSNHTISHAQVLIGRLTNHTPLPACLPRSYNLGGAYRRLLCKPIDLQWKFARYNDPTVALVASDWDRLRGNQVQSETAGNFFLSSFIFLLLFFLFFLFIYTLHFVACFFVFVHEGEIENRALLFILRMLDVL